MSDLHPDCVPIAINRALKLLQVDYIDLLYVFYLFIQIHWPVIYDINKKRDPNDLENWFVKEASSDERKPYNAETIAEVYKVMEKYVDEGKVRSLGLANFSIKKINKLLETARIKPSCIQCEVHPYNCQFEYVDELQKMGLVVTAYQSLGGGEEKISENGPLLKNPVIKEIADKHHKSVPQVLLKWALQRNLHIIPRSKNPDHIASNLELFDFELDKDDLDKIKSLDTHSRICMGYFCVPEGADPNKEIWDE